MKSNQMMKMKNKFSHSLPRTTVSVFNSFISFQFFIHTYSFFSLWKLFQHSFIRAQNFSIKKSYRMKKTTEKTFSSYYTFFFAHSLITFDDLRKKNSDDFTFFLSFFLSYKNQWTNERTIISIIFLCSFFLVPELTQDKIRWNRFVVWNKWMNQLQKKNSTINNNNNKNRTIILS